MSVQYVFMIYSKVCYDIGVKLFGYDVSVLITFWLLYDGRRTMCTADVV